MENIKDYQQYLRGYNYTGITPVIIDFYARAILNKTAGSSIHSGCSCFGKRPKVERLLFLSSET